MARCLILLSAACGAGKSTVKDALNELDPLSDFITEGFSPREAFSVASAEKFTDTTCIFPQYMV